MNWKAQIVYQVFVDRFKRGPNFTQRVKYGLYTRDGGTLREWNEFPSKFSHGMDFFGGDLDGVVEKLDYISSLHVNVLYLTPIFKASTNHKYDTHEFVVDEQFGGETALKRLICEAHKKGIAVILDGVFNHVGAGGKWFNREKKYDILGAYNDVNSPYFDFFKFEKWPNSYKCWYDVEKLPELNLRNSSLREMLFTSENSVLKRYLRMGIDGWRLDCAHDLPFDILDLINENVKSIKDALVIGEVSTYPAQWLYGRKMDAVMNYYFREVVLSALKGEITPYILKNELDNMVKDIGIEKLSKSWNMLSSHDTVRLKSFLQDKKLEKMAVILQTSYVGNPFVYYGEENGMEGFDDPDNRRPMIWDKEKWDEDVRQCFLKALEVKKKEKALNGGDYQEITLPPHSPLIGFIRYTSKPNEALFFFANFSPKSEKAKVPIRLPFFLSHTPLYAILGHGKARAGISSIEISLPPKEAALFKFFPGFSHYQMYKYAYE